MVDFSFSPQKVWNLDVSNPPRIMRFVCKISLSLLETRENTFGFLFSSRNWRKYLKFLHFFCKSSRSLLEPENRSQHFSFLFSKLEMWIPYFSFSSRFDFLASRQCLGTTMLSFYFYIWMLKNDFCCRWAVLCNKRTGCRSQRGDGIAGGWQPNLKYKACN